MNTNLTINFIFIFSVLTLFYIQATKITVVNNENKKGVDNFSCLFGISHCLTLDYVFSHLSDCHHLQIHILILEGNYSFTLDSTITGRLFKKCPAISITGVGINSTSIVCGVDAGFAFQGISQVKIANITFTNCGSIRSGTCIDHTSKVSPSIPLLLSTALYFVYCENVQIINVKIEKSNSTGVVMYNTYGNLLVEGSYFNFNGNQENSLPSNGGFYIEYVYCDLGKVDENCVHQKNTHANYLFKSSTFLSNYGFNEFGDYVPYRTNYYSFGGGGGLSVLFKGNASHNNVTIDDCTFTENQASRGGGLFVEFEDYTKYNRMIINNTNFSYNLADTENGTAGGGVSIGFDIFDQKCVEFNSIVFENCFFVRNRALWGGGFGIYMPSELNVINATNSLSFKNCSWVANRGLLGSAVVLHYWHIHNGGVKMQVKFLACKFYDNDKDIKLMSILKKKLPQLSTFGMGALYSNGIPIIFEESVEFIRNFMTPLALHDTTATFSDNCNASFINNRAWEGGAVALLGGSQMWISPHTVFLFKNNTAKLRGGAIYVLQTSKHDLPTGGNCFLHYTNISSSPNEWNTKFRFQKNCAPTGSSIFATTLLSCAWGASFKDMNSSISNVFDWATFSYDVLDNNTIATQVCKINIEMKTTYFEVIPGKCTALPITTVDDKGYNVNRALWLNVNSTHKSVQPAWNITDNSEIILRGMPNSEASLEMVTDSSRVVSEILPIKLGECPPGYYFDSDKQTCQCSYSYSKPEQHLEGILPCDSETFTAKIKRGYWAGYHLSPEHSNPTDSNLVTGQCPRHYCKTKGQVTSLPDKCNITLLNELLCTPGNRTGTLCGKCSDGYGVAINSVYFDCINCSHWSHWVSRHGWIVYGLTEYVPLTLFIFIILRLDFNPHSGISSIIVMYFQIFTLLNIYSDEDVDPPRDSYPLFNWIIKLTYNVWNLEFLGSILPLYCINTIFNTMDIICIKYITGIYPFVLLAIFFVLNKICSKWCKFQFNKGLAALLTLVFTKFTLLSGLILSWETLSGSEHSNLTVTVVWLNGNLPYGSTTHLIYVIAAVFGLIFVLVITICLLCYPHFSQKVEQSRLCSLCPFGRFQKGYRTDGFFVKFYAGLLFFYRILVVLVFCFTIEGQSIFLIAVITLIFLVITAIMQPYKNWIKNDVAILCFSNIVLINLLSFINLHYSETQSNSIFRLPYLWIQLVLVLLPFIGFVIGFIIKWVIWPRSQWLKQACERRFPTVYPNINELFSSVSDDVDCSSTHLQSGSGRSHEGSSSQSSDSHSSTHSQSESSSSSHGSHSQGATGNYGTFQASIHDTLHN